MTAIAAPDLAFYALALVAVAALAASALLPIRRRANAAGLVGAAAVAGLLAWLGAAGVAALTTSLAAAAAAALRRAAVAANDGAVAEPAGPAADVDDVPGRQRWPSAVLVLAFFVVASHAVLMARWPLLASASRSSAAVAPLLPAVSLVHCLLVALALFAVGCFALLTRDRAWGILLGVETMAASSAVGIVAVSRFVSGGHEGHVFAAAVVASTALATTASRWFDDAGSPGVAHKSVAAISSAATTLLAVVTFALFAGAW